MSRLPAAPALAYGSRGRSRPLHSGETPSTGVSNSKFRTPQGCIKIQIPLTRQAREAAEGLPELARRMVAELLEQLRGLDDRIDAYDREISSQARLSQAAQRLMKIRGIGATTALAIVATVGNAREFKNGRQFAAWLGLVPGQYSTGGKQRLGRITKRGDAYLRNLLVQGARSVLQTAAAHGDRVSRWALELQGRCGYYQTLVAIANKNARIAWALLARGEALRRS